VFCEFSSNRNYSPPSRPIKPQWSYYQWNFLRSFRFGEEVAIKGKFLLQKGGKRDIMNNGNSHAPWEYAGHASFVITWTDGRHIVIGGFKFVLCFMESPVVGRAWPDNQVWNVNHFLNAPPLTCLMTMRIKKRKKWFECGQQQDNPGSGMTGRCLDLSLSAFAFNSMSGVHLTFFSKLALKSRLWTVHSSVCRLKTQTTQKVTLNLDTSSSSVICSCAKVLNNINFNKRVW
jgi:hypothetical protein